MTGPEQGCGGHAGLPAELRALVATVLDRLEPLLDRVRAEPAEGAAAVPSTCASCPVCAVLAALRGERSELAVRLAEQAAGLLEVLRTALAEGDPAAAGRPEPAPDAAPPPPTPSSTPPSGRTVQRIPVVRVERRR